MKRSLLVTLVLIGYYASAQPSSNWYIDLNIGTGITFQDIIPQKQNGYNSQHLYARLKRDNYFRLKLQSRRLLFDLLSLSVGLNYGGGNYVQPIFNSASPVGANGYNTVYESFNFSRNYVSPFLGLSTSFMFYDGAVLINSGIHIAYSRFLNSKYSLGVDDFRTMNVNVNNKFSYRYSLEILKQNAPVMLDIDIGLKFRLSQSLYFNFGINYIGARKMDYNYFYEFKSYTAADNNWSELTAHVNFKHLEQPQIIDNVFSLSLGFSYIPNWSNENKSSKPR